MACSKQWIPSCDWLLDVELYLFRGITDMRRLLDKLNHTYDNYLPCSIHKEQKCEITDMKNKLCDLTRQSEHLKKTIKSHIKEHDDIFRATPCRSQNKNRNHVTVDVSTEHRNHHIKYNCLPCVTNTELNQIMSSKTVIPSCDQLLDVEEYLSRGIKDVRKLLEKMSHSNSFHLKCSIHKERKCETTDLTKKLIEFMNCLQKLQSSTLVHLKEHDGLFRDTPGRAETRRHVTSENINELKHHHKEDSGFSSAASKDLNEVSESALRDLHIESQTEIKTFYKSNTRDSHQVDGENEKDKLKYDGGEYSD